MYFSNSLFVPGRDKKVQSPYLYLQSAGSTGADGSAYGAHLRWLLLRNLGDRHLPKGDHAATKVGFNRADDYVNLYRSRYERRFPTVVDLSLPPDVMNDELASWIYRVVETDTVVYLHFRDAARYAAVRTELGPTALPLQIVRHYCPALLEAEVKDKLFFAAEFDVERDAATVMRAEALSVESNVAQSPLFVSCRKRFTDDNWCPPPDGNVIFIPRPGEADRDAESRRYEVRPACCAGPNLLTDGGFELDPAAGFPFETDYLIQGGAQAGAVTVTTDARQVNPPWRGLPHFGRAFLAVDGSTAAGAAVLRFRVEVERFTEYCFSGWLATLYEGDVSIPLEVRISSTSDDVVKQTSPLRTPAVVETWEPFTISCNSGDSNELLVVLTSKSTKSFGNDFAIDDLWFCKGKRDDCLARLRSENIRSIRFDVAGGHPKSLRLETYDDYLAGARWEALDRLALTDVDDLAFQRLEPAAGSVDARWRKFNDHALLNVANYRHRWTRAGGLKEGVQRYIALSDTDPLAIAKLPGAAPQDGSIEISLLDALRLVSLDFHVARMLGLGRLDPAVSGDTDELIYLAVYDTEATLDDSRPARAVRHYYMGVPTRPLDHRLPETPQLRPVGYGLTIDNGAAEPAVLTDAKGYTPDGIARYVNLFVEPEPDIASLGPFFEPPVEFCAIDKTAAVFYGVEYRRQGEAAWRAPEIAHDATYEDRGSPPRYETLPLPNNADEAKPILRHEEREAGVHEYGAYGINWFSRVSPVGDVVATDATAFAKPATLLPPTSFAVQLIQAESPLMLTTGKEQESLASLLGPDKTLVRVTFDYSHAHDRNYAFGDAVELFFRTAMPRNVVGAVASVSDDPGDPHKAVLHTTSYLMNSQGSSVAPTLEATALANFVGGVLSCQEQSYLISAVDASSVAGEGPIFTIEKTVKGSPVDPGGSGAYVTLQEWIAPAVDSGSQVMFMAVENMAAAQSWGPQQPLSTVVAIGGSDWTTHQETYVQDGETVNVTLRGVWSSAIVSQQPLAPAGVYRIAFESHLLAHHPQCLDRERVDWYKGTIRVPRSADPNGPRKVLEVLLVEHLGDGQPLVLHAVDNAYDPADEVVKDQPVTVSYYPGYRLYLQADGAHDLTGAAILPADGEGMRKTWLGARTRDSALQVFSPVGIPAPIVAVEHIEPLPPTQPHGPEFATWPDFYYKSSYTFTVDFTHRPYSVAFYRANDEAILRALYSDETYETVRRQLGLFGDDDPHRAERWRDLLGFVYADGTFGAFPSPNGYAFPNPDKGGPLDGSPPGDVLEEVKEAVRGAFTALTELPLIHDFIKGPAYAPTPRRQNIRNAQGTLLAPDDPEFDVAPMAKRTGNGFEVQFTDFTLDGTGNNLFFYCAREIGNRARLGEPGPIAGPVQLINTRPPEAPAVRKMYVQEPSLLAGLGPAVLFEANPYAAAQRVGRVLIYRTSDAGEALSVRSMRLVKTIDVDSAQPSLQLADDFEDGFVPYGDPLFYRLVALRRVKKPDGGTQWAPSQPSKVLLTTMIDTANPEAPEIAFTSQGVSGSPAAMAGVALTWPTTAYNGTYYLDTMTAAGNWLNVYSIKTNQQVTVDLAATTLGTNVLPKESDDGQTLYHRFRVRAESSSGLFSLIDKVLTL